MVNFDDDDVEVIYDVPFGNSNGNNKRNGTARLRNEATDNSNKGNGGMIGNYVDFENVFDPFEREKDDLREFFEEDTSEDNTKEDWEKPNVFNDPRKVCYLLCANAKTMVEIEASHELTQSYLIFQFLSSRRDKNSRVSFPIRFTKLQGVHGQNLP